MTVHIEPIDEAHIAGFRACLDAVAREHRFLAMLEAPSAADVEAFVRNNIARAHPQFVALAGERVVGWCDVVPMARPVFAHRGTLGMGVHADFRGQGIGRRLIDAALAGAWRRGLERVDLDVRADNGTAIALYRRVGFVEEGRRQAAFRVDGASFDLVLMGRLRPDAEPVGDRGLRVRELRADVDADVAALQRVLEAAPGYSLAVEGKLPGPDDAREVFADHPPGRTAADKVVLGFSDASGLVGCAEVLRGYPEPGIAWIGLLLFAEAALGRGFGPAALERVAEQAAAWGCAGLQLGVIETNPRAVAFWQREGFVEIRRKAVPGFLGEAIVMNRATRRGADVPAQPAQPATKPAKGRP